MLKPFFTSSRRFLDLAAADLDGNTPLHLLCRFGGIHPAALDADFGLGLPLHGGPRGARSYSRGRSRSESRSVGRLGASPARQYPPSANRARARSRSRTRLESASHSRGRSSLRGGSVEPGASDEGLARGHPVLRALQLLLSHGSDPNAANFKGQRPLHLLLANRFLQDVLVSERSSSLSPSSSTRLSGSRLLDPEEKAGPLLHACARQLLGERADASAPDGRGVAPLFEAAVQQDSGLLELLVRHGAETNYAMPRDLFLTYVTEDGGAERASEDQVKFFHLVLSHRPHPGLCFLAPPFICARTRLSLSLSLSLLTSTLSTLSLLFHASAVFVAAACARASPRCPSWPSRRRAWRRPW